MKEEDSLLATVGTKMRVLVNGSETGMRDSLSAREIADPETSARPGFMK